MNHLPLDPFLEDLEARIDPAQEEQLTAEWRKFLDAGADGEFYVPSCRRPCPPRIAWPDVHINDAIADIDLMVLSELAGVSGHLNGGAACLNVRCNYGTGILPSLFGCEPFAMDRQLRTLPTARPLGSRAKVEAIAAAGIPDIRTAIGRTVFDCAARFLDVMRPYPKVRRHVSLYHPDVQGPIDVTEMVWGCDVFLAFYDDTDLLRRVLERVTDTYAAFMREWYRLVPPTDPYSTHWGLLQRGRLMLRNDSLMNLSPESYVEFVRPMDQRLFDEFGGGVIHFCGRGVHFIPLMAEMRGLNGINMSQPELNDMETIYRHTVDRGLRLVGFSRRAVDAAVAAGRPLRGMVQTWR